MSYSTIIYGKEGPVASVTLNRPERMNAYNQQMLDELLSALKDASQDNAVRVLIVTGAGKAFCSGYEVEDLRLEDTGNPIRFVVEMHDGFHRLLLALREFDRPVIAAVNGAAVAGGLSLALACDIRIASDKAKLGDGSLNMGFVPDEGATYLLPRAIGLEKALRLMFSGEVLGAPEALRLGLVSEVVPPEQLMKSASALAGKIAQGPPIAQRLTKRAVYRQLDMSMAASLDDVAVTGQLVDHTADAIEGVRAFQEKRPPKFKGK